METPFLPDLARLLPPDHAAFRPLVQAGAAHFVSLLPALRQQEICLLQAALPARSTAAARIVALLRQCPTLHKLGQLLARDPRLDAGLRRELRRLESLPPVTDVGEVMPAITAAFGARPPFRPGRRALAEGSVAVVVPFRHGRDNAEGILKLPRPGIRRRIDEEIAAWEALCPWLARTADGLGLPPLPYADTFAALAGQLRAELAPEREQAHLALAARLYSDGPLLVPELLPWCTPQMTAMTRLRGRPIDRLPAAAARAAAAALARGLLARPFWHTQEPALFHADPHAGNLIALDDGGIGVIDWSMAANLGRGHRAALMRLATGGIALDRELLRQAVGELFGGAAIPDRVVDAALGEIARGARPGIGWALRLLDAGALALQASVEPEVLMLRKALANLERVIDDLAPGFDADALLIAEAASRVAGELPLRLAFPLGSLQWPSRLPAQEFWTLLLALPDHARRAWCYRHAPACR